MSKLHIKKDDTVVVLAGGDKGKTLKFRHLCAWQTVKTTPDPFQQSCCSHARQDDPGRADGVQIAGTQQPSLAGQIKDALGVGVRGHDQSVFRISSINVNLPNK